MTDKRQSVALPHIRQEENSKGDLILHCSICNCDIETDPWWGISEAEVGVFINAHRHGVTNKGEDKKV